MVIPIDPEGEVQQLSVVEKTQFGQIKTRSIIPGAFHPARNRGVKKARPGPGPDWSPVGVFDPERFRKHVVRRSVSRVTRLEAPGRFEATPPLHDHRETKMKKIAMTLLLASSVSLGRLRQHL